MILVCLLVWHSTAKQLIPTQPFSNKASNQASMAKGKLLNLFHRRRGLDTPSLSLPGHNSGQEDKQIQDETKSNSNTNKVSELFL